MTHLHFLLAILQVSIQVLKYVNTAERGSHISVKIDKLIEFNTAFKKARKEGDNSDLEKLFTINGDDGDDGWLPEFTEEESVDS